MSLSLPFPWHQDKLSNNTTVSLFSFKVDMMAVDKEPDPVIARRYF